MPPTPSEPAKGLRQISISLIKLIKERQRITQNDVADEMSAELVDLPAEAANDAAGTDQAPGETHERCLSPVFPLPIHCLSSLRRRLRLVLPYSGHAVLARKGLAHMQVTRLQLSGHWHVTGAYSCNTGTQHSAAVCLENDLRAAIAS